MLVLILWGIYGCIDFLGDKYMSNTHIKDFLDYYLKKIEHPDYAVLITGDWGAGKTYFIRQYLFEKNNVVEVRDWLYGSPKYMVVYVSLFGVKSSKDINERIVENFHNFLNSKPAKVLKGIGSIGISVIGDLLMMQSSENALKEKGNELYEYLRTCIQGKKLVFVFDDVERADLSIRELLGYINAYVEHMHIPCILLAEKNKWKEALAVQKENDTLHRLSSTQEKVIGKEFYIQTSFDDIWTSWSQDAPVGNSIWEKIKEYKDLIKKIFLDSGFCNYRALKHTLLDFQRFIGDERQSLCYTLFTENPYFASVIMADFICFQYSYHVGILNPEDMNEETQVEDNSYANFKKIFKNIDRISDLPSNAIISETKEFSLNWLDLWKKWLLKNYVSNDNLDELIKDSIWYNQKISFNLSQIKKYKLLDDESAKKCFLEYKENLSKYLYNKPSELYSIYHYTIEYVVNGFWDLDVKTFNDLMDDYLEKVTFVDDTLVDLTDFKKSDNIEILNYRQKFYKKIASKIKRKAYDRDGRKIHDLYSTQNNKHLFTEKCHYIATTTHFPLAKIQIDDFCVFYNNLPYEWKEQLCKAIQEHFVTLRKQIVDDSSFIAKYDGEKAKMLSLIDLLKQKQESFGKPYTPSEISTLMLLDALKKLDLSEIKKDRKKTTKNKTSTRYTRKKNVK